jgi:hypothetical protein
MKRRQVITGLLAVGAAGFLSHSSRRATHSIEAQALLESVGNVHSAVDIDPPLFDPVSDHENRHSARVVQQLIDETYRSIIPVDSSHIPKQNVVDGLSSIEKSSTTTLSVDALAHEAQVQSAQASQILLPLPPSPHTPLQTTSAVNKAIYFEQDYNDDIFVSMEDKVLLHSIHLRLKNLQSQIGYGHFNVLNFDDALVFAKRFQVVGKFTKAELDFIEKVFATKATDYGFYGEKVIASLTNKIKKQHTFKVPHTGHYLFKEQSFQYYKKLRDNVGEGIILTSGIRSNVKQLHLFLAKVVRVNGNLSRASRSLAPPGYSYHGIGDFDVGRKGWGGKNFTDAFSQTDEFKRMQDLGYVTIRYDEGNSLGVRFEPWHIKVV